MTPSAMRGKLFSINPKPKQAANRTKQGTPSHARVLRLPRPRRSEMIPDKGVITMPVNRYTGLMYAPTSALVQPISRTRNMGIHATMLE